MLGFGVTFVVAGCLATAARGADIFTPTGSLATPRYRHTATWLADGTVLAAGGSYDSFNAELSSADLYNPATRTWSLTGNPATGRQSHTATMLSNGKVVVAGGVIRGGYTITLNSAELY